MKKLLPLVLLPFVLFLSSSTASADTPYTTYAWGPGGDLVRTQDAYTPLDENDLPISSAEDMFITPDGYMYIADSGHGQILKLMDFEVQESYGIGILEEPSGIYVDDQGTMYIADSKKNEIVILDKNGNLVREFGRPAEPLFGINKQFLPRKIAVDARQNLYVISEGSDNGVVQMNTNGNFIGYFGSNASTMSVKMILQRLLLTKAQLDQLFKNEAASPTNITIDSQGLVYTITSGTNRFRSIRRFTISGKNVFPDTFGSITFRDIDVSEDGLVVAVDAFGRIIEYDLNGTLLFYFGAKDSGDQRLGTLVNPTAIARYGDVLYVLDKDKNAVITYQTTAFARQVHEGVRLYMQGFYDDARPYFEEVLNYNGSFIMAYQGIADAYFKDGDYRNALTSYRYSEDQKGYSQAFWELRNLALQRFLGTALFSLMGLWVVQLVVTRVERRTRWFDPARRWLAGLQRFKLVDDLVFLFRFIKQPVDSFYYIKINQRGSLLFAGLIYLWVIAVRVLAEYLTGFTFNQNLVLSRIQVGNLVVTTLLAILIWNIANYLVSTISDGEGRVRDVIIGSAYSLWPYALLVLPIALVSNVLTFNEAFLYSFSLNLVLFWTGMMLFFMVKEIHNYTFSETVRNILITIFTMALFLLTGYILYVLFNQLFDFISAIVQEVGLRG